MNVSAPHFPERRRADRAIAELRAALARMPPAKFYPDLIDRLGKLLDVESVFMARLVHEPAPTLHTLAFRSASASSPGPPGDPWQGIALPDVGALGDPAVHLAQWLRERGWMGDFPNGSLLVQPLLACDGALIGAIVIADRAALANSVHARSSLTAFARLAERVLEREDAVAALRGQKSGLEAAEARFRSLVEQSLAGIFILQGQRFQYINPYLAQLLGAAAPEEIVNRVPIAEMAVPADRLYLLTMVRECLADQRRHVRGTFRALRRDGGVVEIEMHGQSCQHEGRPAIVGVVVDVTESRRKEGMLRQSEEFFRGMFDAMREAVAVLEFIYRDGRIVDYRIVDVNAAFERHTGIGSVRARGRLASELFTDQAPFLDRFRALRRQGSSIEFETYFEPAGRRFAISAFGLGARRFVAVFQDVTEQRRLEQEGRERAEELTRTGGLLTLGEMASSLAHELNQPLTSIANFCAGSLARIRNGSADLERIGAVLAEIGEEAERAGRVLNGVRRFIQKREFVPAPVDLAALIPESVGLAGTLYRDEFAVRIALEPRLPAVVADRVLLQVVLMNLIRNGFESMDAIGDRLRELEVRARCEGAMVEVRVSDRGCGLPQDGDDVFRAFFSTKRDGAGLGLAIARSIIETHGGRIWATRNPGGGTIFHFTLEIASG